MSSERTQAALQIRCPYCKALPGEPCLYAPVEQPWRPRHYSPSQWKRFDLIGTPTKIPHQQRYQAIGEAERREREREWKRQREAGLLVRYASRDQISAMQAIRDLDRREAEQLAAWLRAFGDVFRVDA